MSLTRNDLLSFKPLIQEVQLPDRGSVFVRELTAEEVITFSKAQGKDAAAAVHNLILIATVDGDGKPIFQKDDHNALPAMPYPVSDAIVDGILALSKLQSDAKKKTPSTTSAESKSNETGTSAS